MKTSKYNSILKIGNKSILYNALSDCFALANDTILDAIKNNNLSHINDNKQTLSLLKEGGFIVNTDTNEQQKLENVIKRIDHNDNEFILTINPTMNCNLRCWYCYENHTGKMIMDSKIVENIKKFITIKIHQTNNLQNLYLGFFGGEPFLCFESVMDPLISHYIKECETKGIIPYVSFTTNGTLLNEIIISNLLSYTKNLSFQITLDGCKEDHDKTRKLPNKSSYDLIMHNVHLLLNKQCYVTLRINYTHTNIKGIFTILDDLARLIIEEKKYLFVDFHQVWQDTKEYDLSNEIDRIREYAVSKEINISKDSYDRVRNSCYADKKNQAVINYNGDVFKCTARDFIHEQRYGYINDNGEIVWNTERFEKRMQNKFENESCKTCRIAPLCYGNCSQVRLEQASNIFCVFNYDEDKKDSIILKRFENNFIL